MCRRNRLTSRAIWGALIIYGMPVLAPVNAAESGNPSISLVLQGRYASISEDPDDYRLSGVSLAEEAGLGERGLSLAESELLISGTAGGVIFGSATVALTPENEAEVEEAYIETLKLGHGLVAKAGRFFSGIGYLNGFHQHAWDFVDAPLAYRAFLGGQLGDDGVQLRWVAPIDLFLEVGGEWLRGDAYPAGGAADDGKGSWSVFARIGGDVGASHSWRAGLSHLNAKADARESGDADDPDLFTGTAKLTALDFVWKWAPQGNPRVTNFKFQLEYFASDSDGSYTLASLGTPAGYRNEQRGGYVQAVYQFMPAWRVGLRYDRLDPGRAGLAFNGTVLEGTHDPERISAMVDYSTGEYGRFRLQYNRDESASELIHEWTLQYVISLGPHAAHQF